MERVPTKSFFNSKVRRQLDLEIKPIVAFDGFAPSMKLPIESWERRRKMLDKANAELQMRSP